LEFSLSDQKLEAREVNIKENALYHLYRPVNSENTAGMQSKGSNVARKSTFRGTPSSREYTTPQ
jgi:hypothetical protein